MNLPTGKPFPPPTASGCPLPFRIKAAWHGLCLNTGLGNRYLPEKEGITLIESFLRKTTK